MFLFILDSGTSVCYYIYKYLRRRKMEDFDVEKYREEGDKMADQIMKKYFDKKQKQEKEKAKEDDSLQR